MATFGTSKFHKIYAMNTFLGRLNRSKLKEVTSQTSVQNQVNPHHNGNYCSLKFRFNVPLASSNVISQNLKQMAVQCRRYSQMNCNRLLLPCPVNLLEDITKFSESNDAILIIDKAVPSILTGNFQELRQYDKGFDSEVSCLKLGGFNVPVIYAPVSELTDYHDVRAYAGAAVKAVQRAIKAGAKKPLLVVPSNQRFTQTELISFLGALQELYVPFDLREDKVNGLKSRVDGLSVHFNSLSSASAKELFKQALQIEAGRFVARDIGGGDPEVMAPPAVEKYVTATFPKLDITIIKDVATLTKEYPLFAAVNRAASVVPRHQGRIIYLEYKPSKPARKSLLLVGKGVTYDTGGADIKAGGVMAGMSRDKCGAAAVAGFMKFVQDTQPEDIHVIAALCMVRNSVGEECYVSDEVIKSRAGVRVRVANTDAEGRMCMADALCRMKELAVNLPDPHLFTIATLTGHAVIAAGEGYSIAVDNSVARKANHAQNLQKIGEEFGEPFEISTLRQDDFEFNAPKVLGEDVVQCNNLPSSRTPRGHQIPVSFMIVATGLDKHGLSAAKPLKYTHLDIAASAGEHPKMPTAAPLLALAKTHLL